MRGVMRGMREMELDTVVSRGRLGVDLEAEGWMVEVESVDTCT